jgi:hypothetical protein
VLPVLPEGGVVLPVPLSAPVPVPALGGVTPVLPEGGVVLALLGAAVPPLLPVPPELPPQPAARPAAMIDTTITRILNSFMKTFPNSVVAAESIVEVAAWHGNS